MENLLQKDTLFGTIPWIMRELEECWTFTLWAQADACAGRGRSRTFVSPLKKNF